jgi:hypothetical protein
MVILFEVLTKKLVKDGASQFLNFYMNFYKFLAFFSARVTETRLLEDLRKMDSENAHGLTQNAENGFGFGLFKTTPQRWR